MGTLANSEDQDERMTNTAFYLWSDREKIDYNKKFQPVTP